jgi:hypothetical protein
MSNWADVARNAYVLFNARSQGNIQTTFVHLTDRSSAQLAWDTLSLITEFTDTADYHNILANFLTASMNLRYLAEGHLDLPDNIVEFYDAISR